MTRNLQAMKVVKTNSMVFSLTLKQIFLSHFGDTGNENLSVVLTKAHRDWLCGVRDTLAHTRYTTDATHLSKIIDELDKDETFEFWIGE